MNNYHWPTARAEFGAAGIVPGDGVSLAQRDALRLLGPSVRGPSSRLAALDACVFAQTAN